MTMGEKMDRRGKRRKKKKTVTFASTATTIREREKQPRLAAETARVRMNIAAGDECSLPLATVTHSSSIGTAENPPTTTSKNIEQDRNIGEKKKKKIKTSPFDKMRERISDCRIDLVIEGKSILKTSKFDTELRSRNVNLAIS